MSERTWIDEAVEHPESESALPLVASGLLKPPMKPLSDLATGDRVSIMGRVAGYESDGEILAVDEEDGVLHIGSADSPERDKGFLVDFYGNSPSDSNLFVESATPDFDTTRVLTLSNIVRHLSQLDDSFSLDGASKNLLISSALAQSARDAGVTYRNAKDELAFVTSDSALDAGITHYDALDAGISDMPTIQLAYTKAAEEVFEALDVAIQNGYPVQFGLVEKLNSEGFLGGDQCNVLSLDRHGTGVSLQTNAFFFSKMESPDDPYDVSVYKDVLDDTLSPEVAGQWLNRDGDIDSRADNNNDNPELQELRRKLDRQTTNEESEAMVEDFEAASRQNTVDVVLTGEHASDVARVSSGLMRGEGSFELFGKDAELFKDVPVFVMPRDENSVIMTLGPVDQDRAMALNAQTGRVVTAAQTMMGDSTVSVTSSVVTDLVPQGATKARVGSMDFSRQPSQGAVAQRQASAQTAQEQASRRLDAEYGPVAHDPYAGTPQSDAASVLRSSNRPEHQPRTKFTPEIVAHDPELDHDEGMGF